MLPTVVDKGHYTRMRRNALKKSLMERHSGELAAADEIEKKRLLAQIDAEVEQALSGEAKKWGGLPPVSLNLKSLRLPSTWFLLLIAIIAISLLAN